MKRIGGEPGWPSAHESESVDGADCKRSASSAGRPATHRVVWACHVCQQTSAGPSPLANYRRELAAMELEESPPLPWFMCYPGKELEHGERVRSPSGRLCLSCANVFLALGDSSSLWTIFKV